MMQRLPTTATRGDHDSVDSIVDQGSTGATQPRRQQPIGGQGCAPALKIAEDRDARLQAGQLLELPRQVQAVPGALRFEVASAALACFLSLFVRARCLVTSADRSAPGLVLLHPERLTVG
jgi:hypothetical protein